MVIAKLTFKLSLALVLFVCSIAVADEEEKWEGFTQWETPEGSDWVAPYVEHTQVEVKVSFNPENKIYTYEYKIISPKENRGVIDSLFLDVSAVKKQDNQFDYDLSLLADKSYKSKYSRLPYVNVAIESPEGWDGGLRGSIRDIFWRVNYKFRNSKTHPGQELSGFKIHSRTPPGKRSFFIEPVVDMDSHDSIYTQFSEVCSQGYSAKCPDPDIFVHHGCTVGPVFPNERKIFESVGYCSSEEDRFMVVDRLLGSRIVLPVGKFTQTIDIKFGESVIGGSFSASLNGTDISEKFTVKPNLRNLIKLEFFQGDNRIKFSVNGYLRDGNIALDIDEYVFVVDAAHTVEYQKKLEKIRQEKLIGSRKKEFSLFKSNIESVNKCTKMIALGITITGASNPNTEWTKQCHGFQETTFIQLTVTKILKLLRSFKLTPEQLHSLMNGDIWIGATTEIVNYSWGNPKGIYAAGIPNSKGEEKALSVTWQYANGKYVLFENGVVSSIHD